MLRLENFGRYKNLTRYLNQSWLISLASFMLGLMYVFAFAPFNVWILVPFTLTALFLLLSRVSSRRDWLLSHYCFALGLYSFGVSWVYSSMSVVDTPWWQAVPLTLLFVTALPLFFVLPAWIAHKYFIAKVNRLILLPVLWIFIEWYRGWFLSGLPWLQVGDSAQPSVLRSLYPFIGSLGIGVLLIMLSAVLAEAVSKRKSLPLLAFPALYGLAFLIGLLPQPAAHGMLNVAALQSNVSQKDKWVTPIAREVLDYYLRTSLNTSADLIVWPETAITSYAQSNPSLMKYIDQLAENKGTAILAGIPSYRFDDNNIRRYYNSMASFGSVEGQYDKRQLVPFGEYMPFDKQLRGLIEFFDLPLSNFSAGEDQQESFKLTANGQQISLGALICYEAAYASRVRQSAQQAELLVMISNDAWFGDSLAPHQHLQIARVRSMETGRSMLRSTQTGFTALIDRDGKILEAIPQFERGELLGVAPLYKDTTPFVRWGNWISLLMLIAYISFTQWTLARMRLN